MGWQWAFRGNQLAESAQALTSWPMPGIAAGEGPPGEVLPEVFSATGNPLVVCDHLCGMFAIPLHLASLFQVPVHCRRLPYPVLLNGL
jgi:hypothetical protein